MSFIGIQIRFYMGIIKGVFQAVWPVISGVVKIAWGVIKNVISTGVDVALGIIQTFVKLFTGDWKGAFNSALGVAKSIWKGITGIFGALI
jgi:phage-related protein